jgi:hypothetical protein
VSRGEAPRSAVPPPPTFAARQSQPKPPPPEERETKVLPLDSQNCALADTRLIDSTNGAILARCKIAGSTTRVLVTVLSRTTDPDDQLLALSLRFCGNVIGAEGPTGWTTAIKREKSRCGMAADVNWELPVTASDSEKLASRSISGFVVTLRGQWRRGLGYVLMFSQSGGLGGGSPHDCPYP